MKKSSLPPKLVLAPEVLRPLTTDRLEQVRGGRPTSNTVIQPTGPVPGQC